MVDGAALHSLAHSESEAPAVGCDRCCRERGAFPCAVPATGAMLLSSPHRPAAHASPIDNFTGAQKAAMSQTSSRTADGDFIGAVWRAFWCKLVFAKRSGAAS